MHKNTVAGINKWAEWHCNSDDVEDLDDDNKLIARACVKSPTNVMILITTKNILKLLKNDNLQLSLDATHNKTWNLWPLHARGVVDVYHHFHHVAYIFTSSEATMSYEFLLENILYLRNRMYVTFILRCVILRETFQLFS